MAARGRRRASPSLLVAVVALGGPAWVERPVRQLRRRRRRRPPRRPARPAHLGRQQRPHPAVGRGARRLRGSAADGKGAGTYQLQWAQDRPYRFTVIDAHSLYVEVLGELGLVGFAADRRRPGRDRRRPRAARCAARTGRLYAAVLALGRGLGGARRRRLGLGDAGGDALAVRPRRARALEAASAGGAGGGRLRAGPDGADRRRASCVGVLAVTPAAIAISQSRLDSAVAEFDRGDCDARSTRPWAPSTRSRCGRSPTS